MMWLVATAAWAKPNWSEGCEIVRGGSSTTIRCPDMALEFALLRNEPGSPEDVFARTMQGVREHMERSDERVTLSEPVRTKVKGAQIAELREMVGPERTLTMAMALSQKGDSTLWLTCFHESPTPVLGPCAGALKDLLKTRQLPDLPEVGDVSTVASRVPDLVVPDSCTREENHGQIAILCPDGQLQLLSSDPVLSVEEMGQSVLSMGRATLEMNKQIPRELPPAECTVGGREQECLHTGTESSALHVLVGWFGEPDNEVIAQCVSGPVLADVCSSIFTRTPLQAPPALPWLRGCVANDEGLTCPTFSMRQDRLEPEATLEQAVDSFRQGVAAALTYSGGKMRESRAFTIEGADAGQFDRFALDDLERVSYSVVQAGTDHHRVWMCSEDDHPEPATPQHCAAPLAHVLAGKEIPRSVPRATPEANLEERLGAYRAPSGCRFEKRDDGAMTECEDGTVQFFVPSAGTDVDAYAGQLFAFLVDSAIEQGVAAQAERGRVDCRVGGREQQCHVARFDGPDPWQLQIGWFGEPGEELLAMCGGPPGTRPRPCVGVFEAP